jgi:uncharacterized phage protein (TIGR02218 family)
MIQIDADARTWLESDTPKVWATLIEIYAVSGNAYFFSDGDVDLIWQGRTYSASGPVIERDTITRKLGIEVGEANVTFRCRPDHELEFMPFVQAARVGLLDGARIVLRDAAMAPGQAVPRVVVHLFEGPGGELDVRRYSVEVQIQSFLIQLNTKIPRGSYQPQCLWTLYSEGCQISRAAWTREVTAQAGSGRLLLTIDAALTDGQYAAGTVRGLSGANEGIARTVRANSGNTIDLMIRLPDDVLPGDRFAILPSCNRTMARCAHFDNLARFRGTPYVPQPEAGI